MEQCQHEEIYREGSLGWFCKKCQQPIENPEDYADD
jgi:ribosomal protein L37AE/L43A